MKRFNVKESLNPIINLKKRNFSHEYYLSDKFSVQHQVCLSFLLKCIQITQAKMFRATTSITCNETATNSRGNFSTRKTKHSDILLVKEFIDKFPRYESHYKISHSNIKYLSPFWNIKRMYREYCLQSNFNFHTQCRDEEKPVNEWKFRQIFNTEYNLSFARLKVDTCGTCDKIDAEIKSHNEGDKQKLEGEKQMHLNLVEQISKDLEKEIKMARDPENKTEIFVFDLQRALEMPIIQTGEAYYKRQLWFYNLCVYDEVRKIGYMYVWNETIASRGSQEIASCLNKHFFEHVPIDTRKIILLSDTCSGQNRNIKMALMLKNFMSIWKHTELKSIEQHFFVIGHGYNSCDRSFGTIELQKRVTQDIFLPELWVNVIRQAKKKEPNFVVTEMKKTDFYSSESLEKSIVNRKKTISGNKINWFKIQKIIYEKENPFLLKICAYGIVNTVQTVSLLKRGTSNVFGRTLSYMYPDGRPITKAKYDDLQQLLKNIPENYRSFYRSLRYANDNSIKDYGLALCQSGDEEELSD